MSQRPRAGCRLATNRMARHVLLGGRYLGGHPARERELASAALLTIDDNGVRVKPSIGRTFIEEPWSKITELAAEGPDQVASRFTATRLLLAGPLALAFKKKEKMGYIAARGEFGEFLFEVKGKTPQELRAKIAPWSSRITRPAAPEPSPPAETTAAPAQPDTIARLRALADLRDRGALTDEEFAVEKARLLGQEDRPLDPFA